jgi:hypothetical protein
MEGEEGAVDLMAQIESAIQQIEAAGGVTDDASEVTETPATQAATPEPVAAEAAKPAEAKPESTQEFDRGLARLVAREAEIAAKEKAIEERARSLDSVRSQLRRGNVVDAFKALGLDEGEIPKVVRVAMATQLPSDKVPEQYRKIQEELVLEQRFRETASEVEQLRAELKRRDEEASLTRARQEYEAGLDTFLGAPGEEMPTLARLASTNKQKARERIMAVVVSDAQKKAAALQSGAIKPEQAVPMTPAEAAKVVESELAEYAALFGANGNASTNPTKTVVKGKPSLSNKATQPAAVRQPSDDRDMNLEDRVNDWLAANNL